MPPKERPTGHKRRRDRRRTAPRQQTSATTPIPTPAYKAPVTAAVKPQPQAATKPPVQEALAGQHKYVVAGLRRVGIIIGVLIIALVVLALLIK